MARPRVAIVILEPAARQPGAQSPRRWAPGMRCSICGERIHRWQAFNFDHQVPIACGGARGKTNKKPAHLLCNAVKGRRHPFALRTPAQRAAARGIVAPRTYARLQRIWAGHAA
jgi:hypothetical protein